MHEGAYWRDGWDILDGSIVIVSVVSFVIDNPHLTVFRALRAVRALRPLRLIKRCVL